MTVKAVQDQGSFRILTLALGRHILRAKLSEDQAMPQDVAWVRFPPGRTKLFADERLVT